MKVLFLSAWYPHRYDIMSGLFVQKHAEAVNLYADVKVLYVHPDENIRDFELIDQYHNDLNEIIVYYPVRKKTIFHKVKAKWSYLKAYKKGFKYLQKNNFSPDLIHANVLTRTGLIACFFKLFKHIPYLVTEHWSRYLPENFLYGGFIRKKLTGYVVRNAEYILPVSYLLKNSMINLGLKNPNYIVVNNVVDDFFFENLIKEKRGKKRILHISCFLERAKNISGILNAVKKLSEKRDDFELIIIGTGVDYKKCVEYADLLEMPENTVSFLGEKLPEDVAWWFQNSDVFVLFSNYETAGVVVAESLSSGIPVIGTPTGIIPDVINENNGLIVGFRDEEGLTDKMDYILDNLDKYNPEVIREGAYEQFSYKSVGEKIYSIYLKMLEK
jgi:glycosyltransferase involved in cell wall biosynthesis